MPDPKKIELAREEMLQAEDSLGSYFRSAAYNPDEGKKLTDALKGSRDEFMGAFDVLLAQVD